MPSSVVAEPPELIATTKGKSSTTVEPDELDDEEELDELDELDDEDDVLELDEEEDELELDDDDPLELEVEGATVGLVSAPHPAISAATANEILLLVKSDNASECFGM